MLFRVHIPQKEPKIDGGETCPVKGCCLVASICAHPGRGKNFFPHHRKLGKGDLIWRDEEKTDCIIVICAGLAAASWYSREGGERILRILGKGQTIGHTALSTSSKHPAVLRACTELEICEYPREELERLMWDDKEVAKHLIRSLIENYRDLEQQVKLLSITSASKRVRLALLILGEQFGGDAKDEVELPLTHNDLAALMGLNRVTISRALGELEDQGVVKRGHGNLTVCVDLLHGTVGAFSDAGKPGLEKEQTATKRPVEIEPALELSA